MPQLLPRYTQIQEARRERREAPGIDDMPKPEKKPMSPGADRQARLRGIPVIGNGGGAISGTRPDHLGGR